VPLDRHFQAKVLSIEGERIRLRYDFSDPAQAKDWPEGVPFPVPRDAGDGVVLSDGRLGVRGSTGCRHRAEWQGDILVTCRWISDGTKDIGGFLMSNDVGTDYMTYTLVETYFHGWDGKPGGGTGMIKFGAQWKEDKADSAGFRYMALRNLSPPLAAGAALSVRFGRKGPKAVMAVGDLDLDSAEPGNKMAVVAPGFYAIKSGFTVDDVVIEGTLAKRYVSANRIVLKTEKPIEPEPLVATDPALVAALAAYAAGKEPAATLVKVVGDPSRAAADRGAAADALKRGPRRAVPAVVDLLYHADSGVRESGAGIIKALLGKDYGYRPEGSEKGRAAAIQRLNADLQKHPELLEGAPG
jgi:hypothetical protein